MKTPQIEAPATWVKYEKGLCEGCWSACCTLPVEVREADLVRLGLMSEAEQGWPLEGVAERLYDGKLIQAFDRKSGVFVLAQVSGRDCVFLDGRTRRCTVYEKRPETCRNFPRVGPRPGYCPQRARTSV